MTEYNKIRDIKIYNGVLTHSKTKTKENIEYFKSLLGPNKIFTDLEPSTLTAQGKLEGISFTEEKLINELKEPTGNIMLIGCNFGEKINKDYKVKEEAPKSSRGRKAKPKIKNKRKIQGSGKYFASQITFLIRHPKSGINYKIKLFRNGIFQVPGVKNPSMEDLIDPIIILRDYLKTVFVDKQIEIVDFMAVMRNYKARVIDANLHVDLEKIDEIINKEKKIELLKDYNAYLCSYLSPTSKIRLTKFLGKTNTLNIAEIAYNTDKCFSLNIKFRRPMPKDTSKKTTVKLLKKGKVNFDGGNSEDEITELYYWLQYIYFKYQKDILVDIRNIKNEYDPSILELLKSDPDKFVYEESDYDSDDNII
jgi:hypothetical protein